MTKAAAVLDRDQILAKVAGKRKSRLYPVKAWDGAEVRIQSLSAWQQSEYNQELLDIVVDDDGESKTKVNMLGADVRLTAMGLVNDDGQPMFTVEEVKEFDPEACKELAEQIRELSGMRYTVKEAKGN